jgi:hypothetical protein
VAIDTPATIAVIGAGPIGLEAALYGRFLGYDVQILEQGRIAENLLRWGHARMFTPFGMNRSNLGLAAIKAQDPNWKRTDDDAFLMGREFAEHYLVPLSQTDLLSEHLHERSAVMAIGREGLLKGDLAGDETRGDGLFRLLVRSTEESGHVSERIVTADIVIDASGTFGTSNWMGEGGVPAIGELAARSHIDHGLPDVNGRDHGRFASRRVLVVGDGDSAAANVVALAELARHCSDTWITWVTCREPSDDAPGPMTLIADDSLPQRHRIRQQANLLARDDSNHITWMPGTWVDEVTWHGDLDHFRVRLRGRHAEELQVDRVLANVGHRGDSSLFAALQVSLDPVTEASPDGLIHPEPHFYVLGAKSCGRDGRFLIADGLQQIRKLFSIIGDRAELDLYASVMNLT